MIFLTAAFWTDTIVRAIKTFAQSAVALLAGAQVGLLEIDWVSIASVSGLAALVSILTSIASGDSVGAAALPTTKVEAYSAVDTGVIH